MAATVVGLDVRGSVVDIVRVVDHERNMYAHPNPIARAIFWQRLAVGYRLLSRHAPSDSKVLDFGGDSGAFLPTLARRFADVSVVDLDLNDARRIASLMVLAAIGLTRGLILDTVSRARREIKRLHYQALPSIQDVLASRPKISAPVPMARTNQTK